MYQKVIPIRKQDSNVIIIDIDEKSLSKFGQFPWNRSIFAKIIENVNETNPKAIGFDVFFSEKDKQSPEEIIKSYNILSGDVINYLVNIKGHDEKFRQQLEKSKSVLAVLGVMFHLMEAMTVNQKLDFYLKVETLKNILLIIHIL